MIQSRRKNMTGREYARFARAEAAANGNSVPFWIRDNNPREAGRRARLAARWALISLGTHSWRSELLGERRK